MKYVSSWINYALQHSTITSIVLACLIAWMIYRLGKRIYRRCSSCGSIHYHRWHEREFVRFTTGGNGIGVSVTHQVCLNHKCTLFLEDIELKAYEKEFPISKMTSWCFVFSHAAGAILRYFFVQGSTLYSKNDDKSWFLCIIITLWILTEWWTIQTSRRSKNSQRKAHCRRAGAG